MNIIRYSPPEIFDSTLPVMTGDVPIAKVFDLELRYLQASTWNEVLALHVPASAVAIEASGMRETWQYAHDHPQPWIASTSFIVALGDLQAGVYLSQGLPYAATEVEFQGAGSYLVTGYRWQGGVLYFDTTIEQSDCGVIIGTSPPADLELELKAWYENRLIRATTCDIVKKAEQVLLSPAC